MIGEPASLNPSLPSPGREFQPAYFSAPSLGRGAAGGAMEGRG